MREVMHHGGLKHPFIIDLKEVFLTPEYLAIVMEYAQGGNVSVCACGWAGSGRLWLVPAAGARLLWVGGGAASCLPPPAPLCACPSLHCRSCTASCASAACTTG